MALYGAVSLCAKVTCRAHSAQCSGLRPGVGGDGTGEMMPRGRPRSLSFPHRQRESLKGSKNLTHGSGRTHGSILGARLERQKTGLLEAQRRLFRQAGQTGGGEG